LDYRIRFKRGSSAKKNGPKKFSQLHNRAWNDRFSVTYSKDNDKYHTFYKEFFGKPIKVKTEHITFFPKPQDPEVQLKLQYGLEPVATLTPEVTNELESRARLLDDVREPLKKPVKVKKHLQMIKDWQNYHNVAASKNNHQVHKAFKELFDRPIKLDPNGYH
jgi:hypothetical protein